MTDAHASLARSLGSLLTGENLGFLEEQRQRFLMDPASVDPSWHLPLALFESLAGEQRQANGHGALEELIAADLIRREGHRAASLDPLTGRGHSPPAAAERLVGRALTSPALRRLADIYCGRLAIETSHIDDAALRRSVFAQAEAHDPLEVDWRALAQSLIAADVFERCMSRKFPTKKRFGAEGAEAVVPLLHRVLWRLARAGVGKAIIGTMHRGRLNLLTNVLGRPLEETLREFMGAHPFQDGRAADVPYHLGWSGTVAFADGHSIAVELAPNPSHLEAVNAVALGAARGEQDRSGAVTAAAAVILHTDASVIAQGCVAETIQLSGLSGFHTGGTLHIVINNQIGFTTEPAEARTSRYCTGAWKAVDALILHANGDDLEAVLKAADLACAFRSAHARDGVIDLVCYRRNGHNEIDEPRFTQPLLYRAIDAHPPLVDQYAPRLTAQGLAAPAEIEGWRRAYEDAFQAAYERAKEPAAAPPAGGASEASAPVPPASASELVALIETLAAVPPNLKVDRKVERILRQRAEAVAAGVSWPLAEALALATLLTGGVPVRLTGQDVARGAFSQRHFALTDIETGRVVVPLDQLAGNQARFDLHNSPLSEAAVLGFEYGYSLARPEALTIWEAQFGDFANGAQIVIDQFLAAGAEKWRQASRLVVLLPHGLEGQGPEHSSARIERFLQLACPDNFDVVLPSTPANYFHVLRRQMMRADARPLVILGAKTLLRHPKALSPLADLAEPSAFRPTIPVAYGPDEEVARVLICSGKLAYDLEREVEARGLGGIAILRLEQLHPLPEAELRAAFERWRNAAFVFVQEEPRNMGAFGHVDRRLEALLAAAGVRASRLAAVTRPPSGSPAGSFHAAHERDQQALWDAALSPQLGGEARAAHAS